MSGNDLDLGFEGSDSSDDFDSITATAPDEKPELPSEAPDTAALPDEPTAPTIGTETSQDLISEGVGAEETPDMTDQILRDLEKQIAEKKEDVPESGAPYVAPPDYSDAGRGLVYNCLGKHWACVDGASFKLCRQNYSALKGQSKAKECYPDSVYDSEQGCAWVQKKRISSNAKTDFCR